MSSLKLTKPHPTLSSDVIASLRTFVARWGGGVTGGGAEAAIGISTSEDNETLIRGVIPWYNGMTTPGYLKKGFLHLATPAQAGLAHGLCEEESTKDGKAELTWLGSHKLRYET